ncbi:hypothetical protein [Companilactobacillus insicii]|uniref:hypothetical protein n=1 Tax=Companilactobacillus insicii TaxID=1732567 RepID=UPI0013DDB75F|nr:hypothetical protein [Companilactobacillus insicii]
MKYTELPKNNLKKISGGKSGIQVNLDIKWPALRDSVHGFMDGITGHKRKY